MDSPERVWIAASSSATRRGLEAVVSAHPPLVAIGSSGLGSSAWLQFHPDLVLVEALASELARLELPAAAGAPPHLVITDDPTPAWLAEAVRGSVRGIIFRDSSETEIVAALRGVRAGLTVLAPGLAELMSEQRRESPAPMKPGGSLSAREREVLTRMAEGMGNKEIAADLGISEHTVKFHLGSIFNKLDVNSRTEAVTAGIRQGLLLL